MFQYSLKIIVKYFIILISLLKMMRQIRHQRNPTMFVGKENEITQMNLPSLKSGSRRNENCGKLQYKLNLNNQVKNNNQKQNKKQCLQLGSKKNRNDKFIQIGKLHKLKRIPSSSKMTISTARLASQSSEQLESYMSSRGDQYFCRKKKGISKVVCPILSKHKISSKMRAKMIDWLLQIADAYHLKDETLFLAIFLMDEYFRRSEKSLAVSQLHIIGVTCVFMASKYEQIHPIPLKTMHKDIAHRKIPAKQIVEREADIFKTLNFCFQRQCPFQAILENLYLLKINDKNIEKIKKFTNYFIKVTAMDPNIFYHENGSFIGKACILASLRSMPMHFSGSICDGFSSIDFKNSQNYAKIQEISNKIISLSKTLNQQYQGLENIQKLCPKNIVNSLGRMIQSCAL